MRDGASDCAVRNPFPGLRPFRSDEEHLFFGRENQVDRMIDKLAAHRFLAVVGTSGSGKSSLVNCGLRPALHRGNMTSAGSSWRMAQFRPGSDPIVALAQALAAPGLLFDAWDKDGLTAQELVETTLRLNGLGLSEIVEQARLPEGTRLLVVVDQFEELFRFRALMVDATKSPYGPGQDAVAFVKLLLEARAQSKMPIHIVLTMRSDFLGECAQFLGLAEAINDGEYLVPRLTRGEVRAAIEGPVGVSEATITPVLVTRLLNDVGDNPDQLSILQHALNRTWANWANEGKAQRPLDLTHYEAVGGMADALNRHAERAFGELGTDEHKRLAERIFKALTDKGTDSRGIRRPTRLAQLSAICGVTQDEVGSVLEVFRKPSRSFLVPPAGEALKAEKIIDISHESLMRVWERLKRWGDEEVQSARTFRRLAETAEMYAAGDASLLGDLELQVGLDWRDRNQPNQSWAMQYSLAFEPAMRFLEKSKIARDERRKAAEHAALGKARLNKAIIGALALTVVALVVWINKAYIKEQYYWHWTMGPSVLTVEQEREKAGKPGSDFKECATGCPTMVVVPAGRFMMGFSVPTGRFTMSLADSMGLAERVDPQREVTIAKPFAVSKTEVTFAEWDTCVAFSTCQKAWDNLWSRGDHPVINISWDDAKQYVAWLSRITGKEYRLLSEAEWEYAARSGRQTRFSFSEDDAALGQYAWYKANSEKLTHPVGQLKPNAFGLYDMHGNVDEWVEDPWHEGYEGAPKDGSPWVKDGDAKRHVVRGGAWLNSAGFLHVSNRIWLPSDGRYDYVGLRLARTLNP
jgi:formylglycine-generating enzyme required for sulfatase activity